MKFLLLMTSFLSLLVSCGKQDSDSIPPMVQLEDESEPPQLVEPTFDERLISLSNGLETATLQCPDRLWNGFSFHNFKVVVTDSNNKKAWNWSKVGEGKEFTPIDFDSIPDSWKNGLYILDKDETSGQYILVLNIFLTRGDTYWYFRDGIPEYLIDLGAHEAFHLAVQKDWSSDSTISRGTVYPIDPQPRYYRYMITRALTGALKGDASKLGEARYWKDLYEAEYGEEANGIRFYDKAEGTADYVGRMALGLAKFGCNADEETILNWVTENFYSEHAPLARADRESYKLGARASMLLRKADPGREFEKVLKDEEVSPVDLVLKEISPVPMKTNDTEYQRTLKAVDYENNILKGKIEPWIAKRDSTSYSKVHISMKSMGFNVTGFVKLRDTGEELMLGIWADYETPDNTGLVKIKGLTAQTLKEDNPCGVPGKVIFIENSLLTINESRLNIDSPEFVSINAPFSAVMEGTRQWVCL